MPDGSTITLQDEQEEYLIREWYEANPDVEEEPELQFPLQIIVDGETIEINSYEELREYLEDWDEEDEEQFEFVYPITYTMPDGSTITLQDEQEEYLIREWYEANPDVEEEPELQFPLQIIVDGEIIEINSYEELREYLGD